MARLHLEFPHNPFFYATGLTVRLTDVNAANHLANDSMISMISEARARIVGLMDLNKYGGDIIFRITRPVDGTLVALAKSGFVFFDYGTGKVAPMPADFISRFPEVNVLFAAMPAPC